MNYRKHSGYFPFEVEAASKGAQNIAKSIHEALLLVKSLQTNPEFKSKSINYYDLYYTFNKNSSSLQQ